MPEKLNNLSCMSFHKSGFLSCIVIFSSQILNIDNIHPTDLGAATTDLKKEGFQMGLGTGTEIGIGIWIDEGGIGTGIEVGTGTGTVGRRGRKWICSKAAYQRDWV